MYLQFPVGRPEHVINKKQKNKTTLIDLYVCI